MIITLFLFNLTAFETQFSLFIYEYAFLQWAFATKADFSM